MRNNGKLIEVTKVTQLMAPKNFTADTTLYNGAPSATGNALDNKGVDDVRIEIPVGVIGSGATVTCTLLESASDSPGTASATSGGSFTVINNGNTGTMRVAAFKPSNRYAWVKAVVGDTAADGALFGITATQHKIIQEPPATPNTADFDL